MTGVRIPHSALGRAAGSLTVVLLAYWAYALVAVPLIEPHMTRVRGNGRTSPRPEAPLHASRHQDIEQLFPPEAWERQNPLVLENERGKLLIGQYSTAPDGSVEISPCTIIIYPEGEFADEEVRIRQAIVLQAANKANLAFDEPFDIKRGRIGKLVAGSLVGPILIRSDQKEAGPADDLVIETRDVQLTDTRIFTPHPVKFRWGRNYGSGSQMQMELSPKDDAQRSRGPGVGGLKSFELARDVHLHLVPTDKHMRSAGASTVTTAPPGNAAGQSSLGASPMPMLPIEIACLGPFRFDLDLSLATFRDHVDVMQIQPDGTSDQISGELLALHFGPQAPAAVVAGAPPPPAEEQKLEAKRLEIKGNPVLVHSRMHDVHARGERLEYDLATRRISLSSAEQVIVTRGSDEIRAQQLHYQPGEAGRIGRFIALGTGWLRATVDEQSSQPFEASWARQLWIRPDPESPANDVVSLEGSAQAKMRGMGGLTADEIYCWLHKRPASGTRPGKVASAVSIKDEGKDETELAPDRMLARGNVDLDSPQVTGLTDQLEVWFDSVLLPPQQTAPLATTTSYPPVAAGIPNGTSRLAGPVPVPTNLTSTHSAASSPGMLGGLGRSQQGEPEQQFDVSGRLLRVKLTLLGWDPELSELIIDGQARFEETKAVRGGAKPTLVTGERIHVIQTTPIQATVTVTGQPNQPARVEASGMTLTGGAVNLDRGANRMWIDGPGAMQMIVDRDMQGRPMAQPQPLDVTWQQGMTFDGQVVTFERSVVAQGQHQELKTQVLKIVLSKRIDFVERQESAARPDVAEIVCQGGVLIDARTYDEQGLASIDHMEAVNLALNMTTGDILAQGEGRMTQVRRGGSQAGLEVPGAPQQPREVTAKDDKSLSYLHVEFNRSLGGNMNQREVVFGDVVHTVYGPVPNWDSTLDPEVEGGLGPRGIEMKCEKLKVREMPGSTPEARFVELEAIGNTDVNGEAFRASAAILRYSSDKQKLMLEGDGRRDANIWQQDRPGSQPKVTSAKSFEYWPQTRRVRIVQVGSAGFSQTIKPGN